MAITDAERHRLHTKLDQVLGEEDAAVLISHLPPSGWSDVVRTRDLDQLKAHIDARFDRVDDRFERVDDRFERVDDRFERVDVRFASLEKRFDDRFASLEKRFDDRFASSDDRLASLEKRFDDRFALMESRVDATIERAMRQQTNRFFLFTGGAVTALIALQQILATFGP